MDALNTWLSIIASVLTIVATVISWKNHKDLQAIRNHFNIGSQNKQAIKGDNNVQQSGAVNVVQKGERDGRK